MKYYTGKGDKGDTGFFGSHNRYPKSALRVECLGAVDELMSWVGLCKVKQPEASGQKILEEVQQALFIIQAEFGGSDIHLSEAHMEVLEKHISQISETLPEITAFVLPGTSELCAMFDIARTVARRVERRVVALAKDTQLMGAVQGRPRQYTLAYLNRLSSLLYVLARQEAVKCGIIEQSPEYK